jgi:uncharacterized sulfatase
VLIIADDLGYTDLGFMGSQVAQTPHLDRLAAEGTVFPVGYSTASVCRPALRSLLTGLHPIQYLLREQWLAKEGTPSSPAAPVIRTMATLPRLLAARGYASFQAGKHFEGPYAAAGFSEGMNRVGGRVGLDAGTRLVRETVEPVNDFLERHRNEPFFLWFAPMIPHLPHDPPRELLRALRDAPIPLGARPYYASIRWLDGAVGDLLERLDALGLRERTLVVFASDNGWDASRPDDPQQALIGGSKGKKSLHELGYRTPIVFRWPGRIPAGVVDERLVSLVDLYPTLLDFAGVPVPAGRDGVSLRPVLEGEGGSTRAALIGSADGVRGDHFAPARGGFFWRTQRWHYLARHQAGDALYDLEADPGETRDVAAFHPEVVKRARAATRAWQLRMVEMTPPRDDVEAAP